MKKTLSILLSAIMLFSFTLTGCAAEKDDTATSEPPAKEQTVITLKIGSPTMTVNGEEKAIDEQGMVPVVVNDRTLLPIRAIIEEFGGTVDWNEEKQEVTLKYNADEIKLTIDSTEAYLNNEAKTLDVAPTVINDRTMLPIRFVAESFRLMVDWNEEKQEVTITKAAENAPAAPEEKSDSTSLVVYFSATGNTETLAKKIAAASGSDIVEIIPKEPYTSDDLNYSNDDCRANKEHKDENARPEISNKIENIENYDTIFIGYPIWWGTTPKIINTFLESYDLSGKVIMPFCTSGGSGVSNSVSAIKSACPNSDVKDGFRGNSSTTDEQLEKWFSDNSFVKSAAEEKAAA